MHLQYKDINNPYVVRGNIIITAIKLNWYGFQTDTTVLFWVALGQGTIQIMPIRSSIAAEIFHANRMVQLVVGIVICAILRSLIIIIRTYLSELCW